MLLRAVISDYLFVLTQPLVLSVYSELAVLVLTLLVICAANGFFEAIGRL